MTKNTLDRIYHRESRKNWIVLDLDRPHRSLSWALVGGGFNSTLAIVWRQVTPQDLGLKTDAKRWLEEELWKRRIDRAVAFLTSRDISHSNEATQSLDGLKARCLVTCGLSNALRIGDTPGNIVGYGTINIAVMLSQPMSDLALIEGLTLIAEARTTAIMETGFLSRRSNKKATGTGTDCIVISSPEGPSEINYAGKHTAIGHLIGSVVYKALSASAKSYLEDKK